jgi:hypothetical protein
MKVVQILSVRSTERVRKTVSESGHLIFVTIRTALVSGNSKLNFYDLDMMNITIQHKIYCHVFDPRILSEKEKLSSSIHSYPIRFHPTPNASNAIMLKPHLRGSILQPSPSFGPTSPQARSVNTICEHLDVNDHHVSPGKDTCCKYLPPNAWPSDCLRRS